MEQERCEICGKSIRKGYECILCRRVVCSSCYISIMGVCKRCVKKH